MPIPYPDQVPRLKAFQARHPEIEIISPQSPGGRWTARRNGTVLATAFALYYLLDQLDELLGGA